MKPLWAAASLLLMVGLLVGWGCKDQDHGTCLDGEDFPLPIVTLFLPTDTLLFSLADTAYVDGWVLVTDYDGRLLPNQVVTVTLVIPPGTAPLGAIEWTNPLLRDTTDADGRVRFRFRSYGQSGETTIKATVGNRVDLWQLALLPAPVHVGFLGLELSKNICAPIPHTEDSVRITVTLLDTMGVGIEGINLPLRASGGRLQPIERTDSTGHAATWWFTNGQYGVFLISVTIDTLTAIDSVDVRVPLAIAPSE